MIPQETVNTILDTARIEDIVGDFVTLKRRGANFVACCPFHNEKTPSFYVSPSKGIYKCFGCGKAGSAVGFVMEQEKVSYSEALRYIARRYNIEVVEEEESAEVIAAKQRSESLFLASEFACKFYHDQLSTPEGKSVALAYFCKRGIEDATLDRFSLGWAPSGRTALIDAATRAGYKMEYLLAAGLAVQREDGSCVDKFHERVMFPIHTVSGRVVAFSGRTLKADNPAKYVNTTEPEIYIKSRNLLGIYFAKSEIARLGSCLLVEGNVDMVTLHQLGIRNAVASCGTSLTVEQVRLIKKFTDNVTIMYDGDSAGIHAALRGIGLVLREGLNVRVVLLPEGEDPDSFARKHTLEEVETFIREGERDFISFKTDLLLSEAGSDPLKRAELINDIADTIADIPDPVKRSVYVESCAVKFNIESKILFERVSSTRKKASDEEKRAQEAARRRSQASAQGEQEPVRAPFSDEAPAVAPAPVFEDRIMEPAERELVTLVVRYGTEPLDFESDSDYYSGDENAKPEVASFVRDALDADGAVLANSRYRRLYESYLELYEDGKTQDEILRALLDSPDRALAETAAQLCVEKYTLTVKNFEEALTTTSSWLVGIVPKTILIYNARRLQSRNDCLRRELPGASEERAIQILAEMKRNNDIQQMINKKTGRDKNTY